MTEFFVEEKDSGQRIDQFLASRLEEVSRSQIQKMIRDHMITVSNKPVKANYRLLLHDRIQVEFPEPEVLNVLPEDIPLDILYEDKDLLIVNKPKQMVVHPAPGHPSGTLVNAVLYHCGKDLSGINGVLRPGIVHRIDMDTTGSLIVCKSDLARQKIAEQLKEHSINRIYEAIVHGNLKTDTGTINAPIGRDQNDRKKMSVHARNGRPAVTHYQVLERFGSFTYIQCRLETGRTHQIRVHMASIGHPFWGIRYMAQRNVPSPPCRDRLCTPGPSESVTPGQGPGWRWKLPFRNIFRSFLTLSEHGKTEKKYTFVAN